MGFVKKWIGCILSFVAGVLALSLSACSGMILKGSIDLTSLGMGSESVNEMTKAFKVITDSSLYSDAKSFNLGTEFMTMKVFAIITLVIAVLLIIYSIFLLLKNLNVIKSNSKIFDIFGWSLAGLFLISTIALLVSSNVFANGVADFIVKTTQEELQALAQMPGVTPEMIAGIKLDFSGKVGLYQPFMLATSIVLALVTAVFAFIKRKDA